MYTISRITTLCSILDPTIVANYTCKSKNVNRTTNIGSREIIFQPGVILTNYHVTSFSNNCDKNEIQNWTKFLGKFTTFSKIWHRLSTVYGESWSRYMWVIQGRQFARCKSTKHQGTSKIWKFLRSLSNIGMKRCHINVQMIFHGLDHRI